MKITKELDLTNFEFWGGAKSFADKLTCSELKELGAIIEDIYNDEDITETQLNDIFWFDDEMLCEWINLNIDDVYNRTN